MPLKLGRASVNRRQTIGWSLAGLSSSSAAQSVEARPGPSFDAIDVIASGAIAAGAAPGMQVVIARNGIPLYARGFGLANLETSTAVTPNSVFRIASLSKQFTAAAIWRLAAAEILSVQDPASRFLPFMSDLPKMSLLELMTQTSGLHSDESGDTPPTGPEASTQIALARRIVAQSKVLDFDPGTAWLYSNANYIVLGAVIEAVTGTPYAGAMADLVFQPLGLASTAVDRSGDVVPGRASGYSALEGEVIAFENAPHIQIGEAGGAGAIRSTASDLCLWSHGLFSNRLFSRDVLDRMTAPGRLRDGRLSGDNRFSPDDAGYGQVQYASGLLVSPPQEPLVSYLHYGGINGFCSMLEAWPEWGVTLAALCNADRGPDTPFRPLRAWVRARLQAGDFTRL